MAPLEYTFTVSAGRLRKVLEPLRDEHDAALLLFTLDGKDIRVDVLARPMALGQEVDTIDTDDRL